MKNKEFSRAATRKNLKRQLRRWMPNNLNLVNKELQIFDRMMTRRDFLKTTSLAALTMMINQGCQDGAPSQWSDTNDLDISEAAKASVTTPSNIILDSDIHSSFVVHNPLPAYGSSDCTHVEDHAILESFNPHIMTLDSTDELSKIGFSTPDRTYGIPEHIHLSKDSDSSDYYLAMYEKSNDAQHGLVESKIQLSGTSNMNFNRLITANGIFHNKVSGNTAYGQKLALLANISTADINYSDTSLMRLYYQTSSSELLEPNIEASNDTKWKYIDVIDEFKKSESHTFENYKILDASVYNDGHKHSFIYGTISFDTYYYYGFVITFNNITDTQPAITFFTPEFLSYKSNTIQNVKDGFDSISDNGYDTNYAFEDLSIFLARNFQPLVQVVQSDGKPKNEIHFSFGTLNVNDGYIDNDNNSYDLTEFIDNTHLARYMVTVDTTKTIDYLLSDYEPTTSIDIDNYGFLNFIFDTSNISAIDLWEKVYNQDETLIFDNFVRSIRSTSSSLEVLLASSYYNEDKKQMGLVHKSILIENTAITTDTSYTIFEDGKFLDNGTEKDYKNLWHNDMKDHLGGYESLYDTVFKNSGMQSVEFHCTHNHQGLLRSYYIIRNDSNSLLVGFNEKGKESNNQLTVQNHDNLKKQIQNNAIDHYPPMPAAINPKHLHPWHGVAEDGEILFTSMRQHKIDNTSKKLVENDNDDLLSYMHSSCNLTQKNWNTHEEKINIEANTDKNLVSANLHQVHLHVTNIYRHPVSLNKQKSDNEKVNDEIKKDANYNMFVEVRFNKRLSITDHTDSQNPKTYHPGSNSSVFLSTDKFGKITLEIDVGNKNDKYNGAQIQYRIVDKSQIIQQTNTPVASFENTEGNTNSFKTCNISFKIFQRLSAEHSNSAEVGIKRPDNKTVAQGLDAATTKVSATDTITKGYTKLSQANGISPNNDSPLVSLSQNSVATLGFISSVKHFHPVSWVKHTIHSISSAAQALLDAAKQAVNKLSNSIDDAIASIENGIVTAIEDIATAVEQLWDDVESFATKLWDFLMAILDLETAYDIGQEIKQLRYDQLKPYGDSNSHNTYEKNIYALLEDTENLAIQVSGDVKAKAKDTLNDISDIFQTEALSNKLDSNRNSAKNDQKTKQNNSTMITHIFDQLSRLKNLLKIDKITSYVKGEETKFLTDINQLMIEIFGITLEDMQSGTFPEYLEASVLEFFKVNSTDELMAAVKYFPDFTNEPDPAPNSLIRQIQNYGTDMTDHIQTFATGSSSASNISVTIEKNLKDVSLLTIDNIDEMLDVALKLPTEFLKDDNMLKFMTNSGPLLNKMLKPLGLLLFLDDTKFKNIEDTAVFTAGFAINIAPLMAESAFNEASHVYSDKLGEDLDLTSFITDKTLRTNLNQFIDISTDLFTSLTSGVITKEHIQNVANDISGSNNTAGFMTTSSLKDIGEEVVNIADKVVFKVMGIIIDLIAMIIDALGTISGLVSKLEPFKDIFTDALTATFHTTSGAIQLLKLPLEIINIGAAILNDLITGKRTIDEIVLMSIQAIIDTIKYICEFVVKISEGLMAVTKVQPGEVILYDPTRLVLLSLVSNFVANLCTFVMDVISMCFKFALLLCGGIQNGVSDFLKDAVTAVVVILEIATVIFSFLQTMNFIVVSLLGYIVKSADIEAIVAAAETIAVPVIYALAWISYGALVILNPILTGSHAVSSFGITLASFVESKV